MPVTLLNVFIVPEASEAEFLRRWKETTEHFSRNPGFVETHLHRNTGVGNQSFRFINIATWQSADAWRATHDAYTPGEYSVEGVQGHPAIFESVVDAFHQDD